MFEDTPQWMIDMAKQDEEIARLQDELATARMELDEARRERDAAVAAERERCAGISERDADDFMPGMIVYAVAKDIAAKIRSGT